MYSYVRTFLLIRVHTASQASGRRVEWGALGGSLLA